MKLSSKKSIQRIIFSLARLGLKEVVICPGSRNAPLTISFNRHPAFHCTSIRDERSAAFFALGKAIELKQPVAVLCTSGSAALNFAPAISEAYYQRIPLIVITADRPKEWTDQGDGQTINQTKLFNNFIRGQYDLKGDAYTDGEFWYNDRCLSEGFVVATVSDPGPVHFNIPLSEPLYSTEETVEPSLRIFNAVVTDRTVPANKLSKLAEEFNSSKKVMILAGQGEWDSSVLPVLDQLATFRKVIVLTESTSNLHQPDFIENIDLCITHFNQEEEKIFSPDLLITIGGAIISKRIKALLRRHKPASHWNIHPFDSYMDTYQSLTTSIAVEPDKFFQQLIPLLQDQSSDYKDQWLGLRDRIFALRKSFMTDCDYSDLKVFNQVLHAIPTETILHLSNSSPIRYAQLFNTENMAWCNRGTSGIDGCTSTAMGAASASPEKQFLLITGDVAFQYDINGLWNDSDINNLNIIVINNSGGGIFRIISGPDQVEEMEQFFETSMKTNVENLARQFNWRYLSAQDDDSLQSSLNSMFNNKMSRTVLEIFTNAEKNPEVLESFWKYIKVNLQS